MRPCGGLFGGGSKSSSSSSTSNTDNRNVTESGVAISGSSGTFQVNSTDAVKAVAQMGTETIRDVGGAVVELNQASLDANVSTWDKTVTAGVALVDKLIDASSGIASNAIDKYQPAENKAQETSLKLGMIAAAAVAATVLLNKTK